MNATEVARKVLRVETPFEAFDLHTRLIEWRKSHPAQDKLLHHGYYKAMVGQSGGGLDRNSRETQYELSKVYHNVSRATDSVILAHADTVFLSDELRELVNTAEVTMPDEVVFDTDVYTPCGFVVMETPIQVPIFSRMHASDLEHLIDLILRTTMGTITGERKHSTPDENGDYVGTENCEIQAYAWADIRSIYDMVLSHIEKEYGKTSEEYAFAKDIYLALPDGESGFYLRVYGRTPSTDIDGVTIEVPEMGKAPLTLIDKYAVFYGENGVRAALGDDIDSTKERNQVIISSDERFTQTRRFIVALFRLMGEYVDRTDDKLPRAFSRRASRADRVGEIGSVTTLSLRRSIYGESESGTGRKVTLAHLVRGHWRRQWYPSHNTHRAKWINAHRRGGGATDKVKERPRLITVTN